MRLFTLFFVSVLFCLLNHGEVFAQSPCIQGLENYKQSEKYQKLKPEAQNKAKAFFDSADKLCIRLKQPDAKHLSSFLFGQNGKLIGVQNWSKNFDASPDTKLSELLTKLSLIKSNEELKTEFNLTSLVDAQKLYGILFTGLEAQQHGKILSSKFKDLPSDFSKPLSSPSPSVSSTSTQPQSNGPEDDKSLLASFSETRFLTLYFVVGLFFFILLTLICFLFYKFNQLGQKIESQASNQELDAFMTDIVLKTDEQFMTDVVLKSSKFKIFIKTSLESSISNLQKDITNLQKDITNLQKDIINLQNKSNQSTPPSSQETKSVASANRSGVNAWGTPDISTDTFKETHLSSRGNSDASIIQEYLNNDAGCISKYQAVKLAVPFDYQADLTTGKAKSIKLEENPGYQYIAIPNPRGNNYLLLPLTQNYSEQPIQSSGLKYVYEFQLASEHRNHIADIPVPALASKDHQGNWILLERGQLIFQD